MFPTPRTPDLGMAAGGQNRHRELDVVGQARGQRMSLQMIDGNQGFAADQRNGLGGGEADMTPPMRPGPAAAATPSMVLNVCLAPAWPWR